MKRILPLVSLGLLAVAGVAFDLGCSGDGTFFDDSDDDVTCTKGKPTVKGKCPSEVGDEDPEDREDASVDDEVYALVDKQDVACMTVDADAAYWVTRDGTISALPTTERSNTGPSTSFVSHPAEGFRANVGDLPCGIARDGSDLWVTSTKDGAVHRFSITKNDDGTVSFGASHLTVGGFNAPSSIAIDASYVFVAEYDSGAIRRFAKPDSAGGDAGAVPVDAGTTDGGTPLETIASDGTRAGHLVLDDDSVYWLSFKTVDNLNGVRRAPKAGGAATTVTVGDKLRSTTKNLALARIGGALYFLESNTLRTVPVTGGLATSVSEGAIAFTTDGKRLFVAAGTQVTDLTSEKGFTYAGNAPSLSDPPVPRFFVQPDRLVWTLGTTIFTRPVKE